MMKYSRFLAVLTVLSLSGAAIAAPGLQKNQPIEISSDKLDVFQSEHKAIFSGNVIAIQGTTNMRAAQMTVYYRGGADGGAEAPAADAPAATPSPQGIYRIDADGNVVFTTPTETAIGDKGIYDVDKDTIDLTGANVTLTRGQNILKGTHMNYNMATGRSVLTGGANATTTTQGGSGKPARVHGLFMPKGTEKEGAK